MLGYVLAGLALFVIVCSLGHVWGTARGLAIGGLGVLVALVGVVLSIPHH